GGLPRPAIALHSLRVYRTNRASLLLIKARRLQPLVMRIFGSNKRDKSCEDSLIYKSGKR
uniref:Secreted protein n=1 Tax=Parascaris univalens TaxID=6257 RepID=A0A915A546_PARUN